MLQREGGLYAEQLGAGIVDKATVRGHCTKKKKKER